jgi:hypothetical protein
MAAQEPHLVLQVLHNLELAAVAVAFLLLVALLVLEVLAAVVMAVQMALVVLLAALPKVVVAAALARVAVLREATAAPAWSSSKSQIPTLPHSLAA